ncbi:MAG: hypothetical protein LAP21_15355 [Acidobacteriia bacterium]|nr:hypothetical protein [Terriglobia bacterium]
MGIAAKSGNVTKQQPAAVADERRPVSSRVTPRSGSPSQVYLAQMAANIQQSSVVQSQLRRREELAGDSLEKHDAARWVAGAIQRVEGAESGSRWIAAAHSSGTGKPGKEEFLSDLRGRVTQIAGEVLARIGLSASSCPYIPYWFQYYASRDAAHIETAILRYAPETAAARSAMELIDLVADHVRQAFEQHVKDGSLEGVPEELPQDLHEKGQEEATGGGKVVQGCFGCCDCFEPSTESRPLILDSGTSRSEPSLVLESYLPEIGPPDTGDQVDVSGWQNYGSTITGGYPVYYQIEGADYKVIATTQPNHLNQATVVANTFLQSVPRTKDTIYFTSFDSNPPLGGLGGIALTLLKRQSGKILVPKSPVMGAFTAYHKMGMQGFVIPEQVLEGVKELVNEARMIKAEFGFDIAQKQSRERLRAIQERIKALEQKYALRRLMDYREP